MYIPLRFHSRRHIAHMTLLTKKPTVILNVRKLHYRRLAGFSTNKCIGNVGCICHIFELNCDINSKWTIFSCATLAFSERYQKINKPKLQQYVVSRFF